MVVRLGRWGNGNSLIHNIFPRGERISYENEKNCYWNTSIHYMWSYRWDNLGKREVTLLCVIRDSLSNIGWKHILVWGKEKTQAPMLIARDSQASRKQARGVPQKIKSHRNRLRCAEGERCTPHQHSDREPWGLLGLAPLDPLSDERCPVGLTSQVSR